MSNLSNCLIVGALSVCFAPGPSQPLIGPVVIGPVLKAPPPRAVKEAPNNFAPSYYLQPTMPPEEAARNFYKWYLHALYQSPAADPFKEQRAEVEKHVTARLLQKLANSRRTSTTRKGPDVETEYFFGTLDLDSDWEKYITVLRPTMEGATAVVLLHLIGHDADNNQDLRVVMKKESGLWKIDEVGLWR